MSTYRKMRRDLIEQRGWQIDSDEVEKYRGKRLFAIPSPARQQAIERGLEPLLPAVPLHSPSRGEAVAVEE
jgi:hypothetical protein